MAFSFTCPFPCNHKIKVDAKNHGAAVDEILKAGAIRCRNKYYRCSCDKASHGMQPMPEANAGLHFPQTGIAAMTLSPLTLGIIFGPLAGKPVGIGFTMSLFIMGLSFSEEFLIMQAKFGIFAGSVTSAVLGLVFLYIVAEQALSEKRKDE